MNYPFDQAIADHDERKDAIRAHLRGRLLPDDSTGLWVMGSTLTVDELLGFAHGQAEALFEELPRAIAAGANPGEVIAGFIADGVLFGERIGRKRSEAGE